MLHCSLLHGEPGLRLCLHNKLSRLGGMSSTCKMYRSGRMDTPLARRRCRNHGVLTAGMHVSAWLLMRVGITEPGAHQLFCADMQLKSS